MAKVDHNHLDDKLGSREPSTRLYINHKDPKKITRDDSNYYSLMFFCPESRTADSGNQGEEGSLLTSSKSGCGYSQIIIIGLNTQLIEYLKSDNSPLEFAIVIFPVIETEEKGSSNPSSQYVMSNCIVEYFAVTFRNIDNVKYSVYTDIFFKYGDDFISRKTGKGHKVESSHSVTRGMQKG